MLHDSPSLRREVDDLIAEQLATAAELAAADLGRHDEPAEAVRAHIQRAHIQEAGFTAEHVLGDWFPEASGQDGHSE